jgi:hypothetical protein
MSRRVIGGAIVAAAAAIAAVGFAGCDSSEGQPVTVLRGKSTGTNDARTAISFEGKRVAGPGFDFLDVDGPWIVAGADWWDGKSWHDNESAPCLDNGKPIELGVIEAAQYEDAPGRGVIVWLRCL